MTYTVLKGDIIFADRNNFHCIPEGFLVFKGEKIVGIYRKLPPDIADYTYFDFSGKLIIPGLIDTHLHASQNPFRGTGMDDELIDWLNKNAFSEEAKYADIGYFKSAYKIFADELLKSATTRAVIFATIHKDATLLLADILEKSGLVTYIGKVNMDRNSPQFLCEDTSQSLIDTEYLVNQFNHFKNTKFILTPRFTPSCSKDLLFGLGRLQEKYDLPVQSHLSENSGEIELVKSLHSDCDFYAQTYEKQGLFGKSLSGNKVKTIMAHCVWSNEEEQNLIKENGVFVAHSPLSNLNLSSGIAPVSKYLNKGIKVTLSTDVGGGHTKSMFSVMVSAVQVSKMYWRLVDTSVSPITFQQAFYMATLAAGEFFGKVGTFEKDFDADILVLDDSVLPTTLILPLEKRLERFAYLNGDLRSGGIAAKFVLGKRLF